MRVDRRDLGVRADVPQPQLPVPADRGHVATVRPERDHRVAAEVAGELARRARVAIVEERRAVLAGVRDDAAVRAVRDIPQDALSREHRRSTGRDVPREQLAVDAHRHELAPVPGETRSRAGPWRDRSWSAPAARRGQNPRTVVAATTSWRSSGRNATPHSVLFSSGKRFRTAPVRASPHATRRVGIAARQQIAGGIERDERVAGIGVESEQRAAAIDVEDAHGAIARAGREPRTVGAQRDRHHRARVHGDVEPDVPVAEIEHAHAPSTPPTTSASRGNAPRTP